MADSIPDSVALAHSLVFDVINGFSRLEASFFATFQSYISDDENVARAVLAGQRWQDQVKMMRALLKAHSAPKSVFEEFTSIIEEVRKIKIVRDHLAHRPINISDKHLEFYFFGRKESGEQAFGSYSYSDLKTVSQHISLTNMRVLYRFKKLLRGEPLDIEMQKSFLQKQDLPNGMVLPTPPTAQ